MNSLAKIMSDIRGRDLERLLGLRPPYPPVALEVDHDELVLVRLKRRRRGRAVLEAHRTCVMNESDVPTSIFQLVSGAAEDLPRKLSELFESSGTRPGRVSLVLPDNLAKVTLLQLPERPASNRQLDQLIQSKMRRAVPFRMSDACLSYQVLPGEGREILVLVIVVRRALVERYEQALEELGARVGLIDISTPNLINLCRGELSAASCSSGDAALLNCSRNYFSLVIVRKDRLIFFRCKTYALGEEPESRPNGVLAREIATSFAYYREKLAGEGVTTVFVRSVSTPVEQIARQLIDFGCEKVEAIDPVALFELGDGVVLDRGAGQRIAPALGAAVGRGA